MSMGAGMVAIPAGDFMMGSAPGVGEDDEHPQHRVHVAAFAMDLTEVTVSTYGACVSAGS
jgi:formylglycine-generating enzyme required for sulfatase activity